MPPPKAPGAMLPQKPLLQAGGSTPPWVLNRPQKITDYSDDGK